MTHGMSDTRLYRIYKGIEQRCYNIKNPRYKNYGGKEIKISKEWANNFEAFYEWSISNGYNENLTIDRINPSEDYEPKNCQWITQSENSSKARAQEHRTDDEIRATQEKFGRSMEAWNEYRKEHITRITITLNNTNPTDKDILDKLDTVNKQGYIKELIRKDIKG